MGIIVMLLDASLCFLRDATACPPDALYLLWNFFHFLGAIVDLNEYDRNVVASLLKLYLRELPEPLIPAKLNPKFEEATSESLPLLASVFVTECYY